MTRQVLQFFTPLDANTFAGFIRCKDRSPYNLALSAPLQCILDIQNSTLLNSYLMRLAVKMLNSLTVKHAER
jgi:hypothetical protein